MRLQELIAAFVVKRHRAILLLVAVVTVALAVPLRHLRIRQDEHGGLPKDDPDIAYFENFRERFGNSELLLVALETDEVFTPASLGYLRELTQSLRQIKGVDQVLSLANAETMEIVEGDMVASPFLPDPIPTNDLELAALRNSALAREEWAGQFLATNGRAAAINITLAPLSGQQTERLRIAEAVRQRCEAPPPGVTVYMTGISALLADFSDSIQHDLRTFMWMTPILIVAFLFLSFRTLRGVVIPLVVIFVAIIWTFGIMSLVGNRTIGMATVMLPTLLAVISLSDIIHVLAHYHDRAAETDAVDALVKESIAPMFLPCLLTSLTTAVGFGSLALSRMGTLREFGVAAALGILLAYVLGMTLVPSLLACLKRPSPRQIRRYHGSRGTRALDRLAHFVLRDRAAVYLLSLAVAVLSILGLARLKIETQMSSFLPRSAPSIRGAEFAQKMLAGFGSLDMVIEAEPGTFEEPWALRELARTEAFVQSMSRVDRAYSLATIMRRIHATRTQGEGEDTDLPETRGDIAEYMLLLEMSGKPELTKSLVTEDLSACRLSARIHASSTSQQEKMLKQIERFADENLDKRLVLHTTGMPKLYASQVHSLVRSQLRSLGVTMLVIVFLLLVTFRSLRIALISIVPNILPVMATLGVMGWLGTSLNVSTVMIACIAIGIAVDDTIHFLARYLHGPGPTREDRIRQALRQTGRAMVATSLVIAGGFSVLCLSNFGPNRSFGVLTAVTMLTALAADLLLLPRLLRQFGKEGNRP